MAQEVTRQEFEDLRAGLDACKKWMAENAPSKAELRERAGDRARAVQKSNARRTDEMHAEVTAARTAAHTKLAKLGMDLKIPSSVAGWRLISTALGLTVDDVELMISRGQLRETRTYPSGAVTINRDDVVGLLLQKEGK